MFGQRDIKHSRIGRNESYPQDSLLKKISLERTNMQNSIMTGRFVRTT